MKTINFTLKKLIVVGSASVFTLLAVPVVSNFAFDNTGPLVAVAQAAEDGHGGEKGGHGGSGGAGGEQAKKGSGGSHESASGGASKAVEGVVSEEEEEGGKGKMGSGVHGQGSYQDSKQKGGGSAPGPGGTNDEPNDAKGPRYSGGAGTGSSGGKPIWAQEGIPEVELGRLNVARAPAKLLDKSLVTALTTLNTLVATTDSLYEAATLEAAVAMLAASATRIDSPIENLAMLKDFLADGLLGSFDPTMSDADFAALLLGSAADKTVPITADTVKAMSVLLGVTFPDSDAVIAADADLVRSTINIAHGE